MLMFINDSFILTQLLTMI